MTSRQAKHRTKLKSKKKRDYTYDDLRDDVKKGIEEAHKGIGVTTYDDPQEMLDSLA